MTAQDQSEILTIQVKYTKSDLYSACVLNSMRHPLFWMAPLAMGSMMFQGMSGLKYGWVIAIVVGLFFFPLIPYAAARASAKNPGVFAPIIYTFSADGITAQYKDARNSASWSLVKGTSETKNFIFIKMQRGTFHLVPKRQISDDQVTLLRQMIKQHLRTSRSSN